MYKKLGPGILLAGAAIGGSHLVASTQAGAHYGWSMLTILILINFFKYPFFLYSQKYTAATGETILHGYQRLGTVYISIFFVLNIITGLINIAGVSMITGSLATNFSLSYVHVPGLSAMIMVICVLIILLGGFSLLKNFGKIVVLILGISTLAAMAISLVNGPVAPEGFQGATPWTIASFGFVIVFMGWMPAPIDVSVWPSLWMKSEHKNTPMKDAMFDFHTGYIAAVFFAIVFLILGKMVMYGSGVELSGQGSIFARQLIDLYTQTMGPWARPLIIAAAFSAMFSTSLTTIDGYPRSLATAFSVLFPRLLSFKRAFPVWLIFSVVVGILIINYFIDSLANMLALAMIVSFLTAPVFAWLNYKVMLGKNVSIAYRPSFVLRMLSIAGIIFQAGFGLVFFYWYFFM